MVNNKYINAIVAGLTALAVLLCGLAVWYAKGHTAGSNGITMEYESALFCTDEPMEVNIQMDDSTWAEMLENAMAEEYYSCDVVINGETFKNVGIRPKGNTSLSSIVNDPDTERYSLKIEFDHYVEGQTCHGLDKLILNNNYADATNMKEAVIYDMFHYLGADASLYNYAAVSVNGTYWGVYLALETVEDSFLMRNYGTAEGNLYKPDTMEMGGGPGNGDKFDIDEFKEKMQEMQENGEMPEAGEMPQPGQFPGMPGEGGDAAGADNSDSAKNAATADGKNSDAAADNADGNEKQGGSGGGHGGPSMGGNGSDLNYVDDDLDSYSSIWDSEINDTDKKDHKRVVKALKNISEGKDIEKYMNVDNLLKYMAVHTFAVNMDSLSGNMTHNYYLYESDGRLNIIPWDYNLSFGGMGNMGGGGGGPQMHGQNDGSAENADATGEQQPQFDPAQLAAAAEGGAENGSASQMQMSDTDSATEMVNYPIDTPFQSTNFFDALLENEEYKEQYHEYLRQLSEDYVEGGEFDALMERLHSQIDDLVKTDPTAFYDYDTYQQATAMLEKAVKLRAKSVLGQLDGTIPSTREGQNANPDALLDASSLDIEIMGTMMGGGGPGGEHGGGPGGFGGNAEATDNSGSTGDASAKQQTADDSKATAADTGKGSSTQTTPQQPNGNVGGGAGTARQGGGFNGGGAPAGQGGGETPPSGNGGQPPSAPPGQQTT